MWFGDGGTNKKTDGQAGGVKLLSFVERTNVEASKCQAQKPAGDAIVNLSIACSLLN